MDPGFVAAGIEDVLDVPRRDTPRYETCLLPDAGKLFHEFGFVEDGKGRPVRRVAHGGSADLQRVPAVQVVHHLLEFPDRLEPLTLDDGCIPEDQPLIRPVGKPHEYEALRPPLFKPGTGPLQFSSIVDPGENHRGGIDVNFFTEFAKNRQGRFWRRVPHPLPAQFGICRKDGK